MKPKTIEDILVELHLRPSQITRAKAAILELVRSKVVEKHEDHMDEDGCWCCGWDMAREQTLKNLESI